MQCNVMYRCVQVMTDLADQAPDEFIDPITLHIMQHPMKTPTSPYVLDRQTLLEHLAINPTG
jgi:hypothetical protein